MAQLWESTLSRLGQSFLQHSVSRRISTLVIHAADTDTGHKALKGPPDGHWLRDVTGIGKPTLPPAFIRLKIAKYPLRTVYFGGTEGAEEFAKLCDQAGGLLDQPSFKNFVPPELFLGSGRLAALDVPNPHPDTRLAWVLLLHEIGLSRTEASAIEFERSKWDEDGWQPVEGSQRPPFFFSYSRNSFEDSAAAIDVLLSSPPRDAWLTVPTAARALGLNADHVGRLVTKGKIRGRGTGKERRVSPRSVIEYMLNRQAAHDRADGRIESDAEVGRKFRDQD